MEKWHPLERNDWHGYPEICSALSVVHLPGHFCLGLTPTNALDVRVSRAQKLTVDPAKSSIIPAYTIRCVPWQRNTDPKLFCAF